MAEEMKLTNEEAAALDQIDNVLQKRQTTRAVEAPDATDLCDQYHSIRGALLILVKVLKKIPGFGAKAATALEFLMGLADTVCPVTKVAGN
jgi:hypothetical protein